MERDRGPRGLGSGNEKRKLGRPSRVALRYGGSNLGSFFHPGGGLCGREDPTLESEKMSASRQLEAVCELRTTLNFSHFHGVSSHRIATKHTPAPWDAELLSRDRDAG